MNVLSYGIGPQKGTEEHFRVTVVFTTPEATLAALRTASNLAARMTPHIALVEVVPFRFPFDRPPVSVQFHKARLLRLIAEAGVEVGDTTANVVLCSDQLACLREVLPSNSLVVIGGSRGWNSPEVRLERLLILLGHEVVFVNVRNRLKAWPLFEQLSTLALALVPRGSRSKT